MVFKITLRFCSAFLLGLAAFASLNGVSASAQSNDTLLNANPQSMARGIGHFERARSLLLAAVREFDSGYKYVKPDQVIDSEAWRKSILTRAEEMESLLSPRPREAKVGSRFEPNSGLLGARTKPEAKLKK